MRITRRILPLLLLLFAFGCASGGTSQSPPPASYDAIPRFEAGGPITAPKVISRVEPTTSRELRDKYSDATATVEVVLDEQGRVVDVLYVEGNREWARLLMQAVRRWRFEPGTLDGKPVAVRFPITSNFRHTM
jgi:periplasmic protein TonB